MSGAEPFRERPLRERLRLRALVLDRIRGFFRDRGFFEVDTPQRVVCPGIDPYIDAIPADPGFYLASSPELEMKKLLAAGGITRLFQVARAFRSGERGDRHHAEFTLLEWYAAGENYSHLMEETEALVRALAAVFAAAGLPTRLPAWPVPFPQVSVDDAFERWAGWRPSANFEAERFFEDLVEKVEPALRGEGAVFLRDYPAAVGALARRKPDDPAVCERIELYLDGLEICNGFSELTDAREQEERFERDNAQRERMGRVPYPVDRRFLDALESGLPASAGNAFGVDRLIMALVGAPRLADVTLLAGGP